MTTFHPGGIYGRHGIVVGLAVLHRGVCICRSGVHGILQTEGSCVRAAIDVVTDDIVGRTGFPGETYAVRTAAPTLVVFSIS